MFPRIIITHVHFGLVLFLFFLQNIMAKCYWCYFSVFATTYPKYNNFTEHVAAQTICTSVYQHDIICTVIYSLVFMYVTHVLI